jgi:hypothetical protein
MTNSKKQTGVWIDGKKAILVSLNQNDHQVQEILSHIEESQHHDKQAYKGSFMGTHHLNHERTFEERKRHQVHSFLKEVITSLAGVTDLYICGPSELKTHLKTEVEADRALDNTLRGVDACEQMTEHQLVAKVRGFFELI